ncbi:MAG: peptidase [Gemmatimonadetes bacterium]|nr:peptidase [Gemmatimonadota bacterium]
MSRLRLLPLLALFAGCATTRLSSGGPVELPRKRAPQPTEGAITPGDLMSRLYVFADDSMLGRESGTLGNVIGTNYVAREMERMGLQPGGENGTWFQTVPVVVGRVEPSSAFTVGGTPFALWSEIAPQLGGTATRALQSAAPVVFGGRVGGAMLDPAQAAGKVVVLLPAAPVATPAGVQAAAAPFSGPPQTARAQQLTILPYSRTAAAIVYVTADSIAPSAFARHRQPRMELGTGPAAPATTSAPVLHVTASAARRLFAGGTLDGLAPGAAGRTLDAKLVITRTPAPYPARNVIGILRGSDPSRQAQYVAIGAHNDHIGLTPRPLDPDSVLANNMVVRRQGVQDAVRLPTAAEAGRIAMLRDSLRRAHGGARADSVNNGADDDGSGTVAMLEIAERFATAGARPARSLLFVSHTGEEKGLWGSQWFTDHPTVPRDSIVAQLNMDMVGRGKPTDIMGRGPNNIQLIGPRRLSTQLGDLIDAVNAARTPRMDIDASFDANGHPLNRYCRSDHYMYARYGIPITYFSLGYHTAYHQVIDEPHEIDYEHMARVAGFVHDIASAVANRPERLVVDKPRPDPQGGCRQ